jgi:hypothetical protein
VDGGCGGEEIGLGIVVGQGCIFFPSMSEMLLIGRIMNGLGD